MDNTYKFLVQNQYYLAIETGEWIWAKGEE